MNTFTPNDSTNAADAGNTADAGENSRLMSEWSIAHGGRYYHFDGYRYERLADAIAYAQLVRTRPSQPTNSAEIERIDVVASPDAAEQQLMRELSISLENGCFVFDGFRYDSLIDAANYARLRRQLDPTTH